MRGFSAYVKGEALYVHHGSLGRGPQPMKRWPIVLILEKKPTQVYINVSMAR